ncbi:hypothetical protein JHL21_12345 [Devosia sp. WQ 349]|uniref:hypothetical protein n=1 Tax=Devosia sp. WQ 349K1 TaxID=2800329 RepID=UPI001908F22A|nr:hypothetical protein [Devosia sp. WQ 349K1]MBK1795287.1 hypothetical protein [Devosia sp. WQ 349K1]
MNSHKTHIEPEAGNLRFGLDASPDWLSKAKRELERITHADDADKMDHAINAAITIGQLADWIFHDAQVVYNLQDNEVGEFKKQAKLACQAFAIITDISNATKHFSLNRKQSSQALRVSQGQVIIPRDFQFTDFVSPVNEPFAANIRSMRTLIDDDEIVGFHYVVGDHRVSTPAGPQSFEISCSQAISFWEDTLNDITNGQKLPWFNRPHQT